jgi:hypothetical protein
MGVKFYIIIIIFVSIAKTYSVHNTEDFMTYLVLPSSVVHQSKCFPTTLLYIAMSPASPCRFIFLEKKILTGLTTRDFAEIAEGMLFTNSRSLRN